MLTVYQRIIIIGYGAAANKVLAYVAKKRKDYGYGLEFIEHEVRPLSNLGQVCREKNIPYARIEDKDALTDYLDTINEKTLIISAYNTYLFRKSLIDKENITIINFHNALLPDYPGRNAPSWAIYMGEKETGITWHYVTAGVDEGDIIIQKRCSIGEDIKAFELTEKLVELAYNAFIETFDDILKDHGGVCQKFPKDRKVYYSKEIPSEGYFDLSDSPEYIYRLLRSVDYGGANIFPKLRSRCQGETIEILRYRKIDKGDMQKQESYLYLPFGESKILKLKYRKICE